jgi:hypothetical protein
MKRGFVIVAQNTTKVNYIKCAEVLAKSLHKVMPYADITLITNDHYELFETRFDRVVPLPYGDLAKDSEWKLINDWQVYEASPYDYTIKLEADMFIPQTIEHWWDILKHRDLVVSSKIRNYKQEISSSRYYRQFIDDNNLPDVYNSITYFRKSDLAEKFFKIVRDTFENWDEYKKILKCSINQIPTTDWSYSIACHILGVENTTLPNFDSMSMVHMKQHINDLLTEDWTKELVYEINKNNFKINTIPQMYPFHYHVKNFADKLNQSI